MRSIRIYITLLGISMAARAANNISGRVTDAQTGEGIARARVIVQSSRPGSEPLETLVVLTSPDGSFGVRNVPDGACQIWSERSGYLGGQRNGSQASIMFPDAAPSAPVMLQLTPQAVIAGRVVDQTGAGFTSWVKLWRLAPGGEGGLEFHRDAQVGETGEFRFAGLEAGRYYLEFGPRVTIPSLTKTATFAVRFYPNAQDLPAAKIIQLQPGQEEPFTLHLQPAPAYQVRGRIPAATQVPAIALRLPGEPAAGTQVFNAAWDDQSQSFTFQGVPPGVWVLDAGFNVDGKWVQLSKTITVRDADLDGIAMEPR